MKINGWKIRICAALAAIFMLVCTAAFAEVDKLTIAQMVQDGNVVTLYVNVLQDNNMPVEESLDASRFTVSTNIGDPMTATVDTEAMSGGVAYIICVDVSGSVKNEEVTAIRESINSFAANLGENDYMRIYALGEGVEVLCDFTRDPAVLSEAVNKLDNKAQKTYLFKGISDALDSTLKDVAGLPDRAAIIVFTDGVDDSDGAISDTELLDYVEDVRVPIYIVGLEGKDKNANLSTVGHIARKSGGIAYSYKDMSVADAVNTISGVIRNSYVLKVEPEYDSFGQQDIVWKVNYNTDAYNLSSANYIFSLSKENVSAPTLGTVPAEVTPAPVTPAPVTPEPITPAPVTPEPITPAPVTPEPAAETGDENGESGGTAIGSAIGGFVNIGSATDEPTAEPTVEPTAEPIAEPTAVPTAEPAAEMTAEPEVTEAPVVPQDMLSGLGGVIEEEVVEETEEEGFAKIITIVKSFVMDYLFIVIAGVLVLAALIIVLIIVLRNRSHHNRRDEHSVMPATGAADSDADMGPYSEEHLSTIAQDSAMMDEATIANYGLDDSEATVAESPKTMSVPLQFLIECEGQQRYENKTLFDHLILGRGLDCDLVLDSKSTSRQHAAIINSISGMSVKDLGSRNKTYLNGNEISDETPLQDGDVLKLGSTIVQVKIVQ